MQTPLVDDRSASLLLRFGTVRPTMCHRCAMRHWYQPGFPAHVDAGRLAPQFDQGLPGSRRRAMDTPAELENR